MSSAARVFNVRTGCVVCWEVASVEGKKPDHRSLITVTAGLVRPIRLYGKIWIEQFETVL